jgi:hypothetical protein
MWPYGEALRRFRLEGDSDRSREALAEALRVNPHVATYLTLPLPDLPMPPHYALGSVEEAVYVAGELRVACEKTPGALDWVRAHGGAGPRTPVGRRPSRKTPRRRQ